MTRVIPLSEKNLSSLEKLVNAFYVEDEEKWYEEYTDFEVYKNLYIPNKKNIFFVAENRAENPLGFIMGYERTNEIYAVGINYVLPYERKRGVAHTLKDALTREVRYRKYKEIWSDVSVDNVASVTLNFSSGWKPEYLKEWNVYRFKLKLN